MKTPERILVVVTRRIGDVLLCTPLIHSLKVAWATAAIDVLVFAGSDSILLENADISNIITVAERPTFSEHLVLIKKIWRQYDLSVSCLSGDRPTIYAWLAGKYSIGLLEATKKHKWKKSLLNQWVVFDSENMHTVSMYLALAKALNTPATSKVILNWNIQQANYVDGLFDLTKPYAVLHIYPKYSYKMWHQTGWLSLANWLISNNIQVVLTGSKDVDEVQYVANIASKLPVNLINLCGKLNLNQIAYLLSRANLYVGPDTSITHIAAAMNTPSVALFGPSNAVKWAPWPAHQTETASPYVAKGSQTVGNISLLQGCATKNGQDCVPCYKAGCDDNIHSLSECLNNLSAQTVINAVSLKLSIYA